VILKVPFHSEFSERFVQGMADRMTTSRHKYGPVADAYPHKVNAIASLKVRLAKYEETGNTEYLMDMANFAMIEYMHPRHPRAHFKAEDSLQSPGRVRNDGSLSQVANTHEQELIRSGFRYSRDGD
jgi:hypothetical protein